MKEESSLVTGERGGGLGVGGLCPVPGGGTGMAIISWEEPRRSRVSQG